MDYNDYKGVIGVTEYFQAVAAFVVIFGLLVLIGSLFR